MKNPLQKLTVSAVFAALILVMTAYLFHLPIGSNNGYLHFGDAFIYLAASALPTPYAIGATVVGAGLADVLTGAALWAPATVIIKTLMTLCFSSAGSRLISGRNAAASGLSGVICVAGYYVAEGLIYGNWMTPLTGIPMNLIQAIGSAILYLVAAFALDKAGFRRRLERMG